MSIKQNIKEKMLSNIPEKQAYKNIYAILERIEKDNMKELTDAEVIKIFEKQVKKQEVTYKLYVDNNRSELAEKEKVEIDIMTPFIPQKMSEDEVKQHINEYLEECKSNSEEPNMRGVMNFFNKYSDVDRKLLSELFRQSI
jgi:uncharacterized protein YqeY